MDETNLQGESPAEAANSLPVEAEVAESAPAAVEPSETPEPEKKDRLQERFDKLTREKYDALRERDALEYRLRMLEEQQRAAPPQPVAPATAPTLEQYGYDEAKYQAAVAEFLRTEARREAEALLKQTEEQRQRQARVQTWQQKEAEFAAKQADYRDVAYDPSIPITAQMAEAIAESDVGPAIAYYLGKNRDEAAAIAAMSPIAAARAIGRIEAKLEAKPVAPPVTKAPPPPPKIEAADGRVPVKPDDPDSDKQMSDAEWMRRREQQLKRRKG